DAVRIVDEGLQQLISEQIGSPFYAGVPNRDFLICWSKNNDKEFQNQMRSQISSDFDERPYPLSRNAFEVNAGGKITPAIFSDFDERALSAESN
ncbi:MAG TPA: hypothetical protein VK612_00880, partial [Pyrinomonadaceae bacterium]|nr:hypothetical protein [Pyrinomonadaceae bacterium]